MAHTAKFQRGVHGAGAQIDAWLNQFGAAQGGDEVLFKVQAFFFKGSWRYDRGIIQMELDEIPDNATVTSGILTLNVAAAASGAGVPLEARVSSGTDWTSASSYPSWSHMAGGSAWGSAGGSPSAPVVSLGNLPTSTGPVDYDITLLVREAVDRRNKVLNFLLMAPEGTETTDEVSVSSSNASNSTERPLVTVKYIEGGGSSGKSRAATMGSGGRKSMAKRNRRHFRG